MSVRCPRIRSFWRTATLLALSTLTLAIFPAGPGILFAQAPPKSTRKVVQRVEPEYPWVLRNGHFEGRVVAEATVLANGSVSSVEVKGGNPMFAEYVVKALMKWKYAPAPTQTVELVSFNFTVTPRQ